VNPVDGLYDPFPATVALPTVVPPEEQSLGGEDCGPNTVNVIVPVGAEPDDKTAEIDEPAIGLPAVPDPGPLTDNEGLIAVTVKHPSADRSLEPA
jgi:hypothetical protein